MKLLLAYFSLFPLSSTDQFCGGTLISSSWVLTAGHCTDRATEVRILLAVHDIRDNEEPGRVAVVSRDIRPHPDFNLAFLVNDIALVRYCYNW